MARSLPVWLSARDIFDLLRLATPIAVSRMAMMLMSVTDAIVLGQNAPGELPYILNSWLPMGISLGLGMGLLLGVQILTAELSGVGKGEETGRVFRRGMGHAAVLGLTLGLIVWMTAEPFFHWLFVEVAPEGTMSTSVSAEEIASETASATRIMAIALPGFMISSVAGYYLEALRRPLIVTVVTYIAVVANLVLDLAFVAGWFGMPQLGADGVAIATSGSRWAVTIALLIVVIKLTPALKPSPEAPKSEGRRQLAVGTGTAISNVAEWGGFNFTFVIATWVSLVANAAYGYAIQFMGLAFMVFLGIGSATSVRVAEAYGRKNRDEIRNASRLGVTATIVAGLLLGVFMVLLREPLSGLLVDKEEALIDGVLLAPIIASLLVYVAFAVTFDGLQATASMALRAQEVVWLPSIIHIGSFFFIMIPACYWFGLVQGGGAIGMMQGATLGVLIAGFSQFALLEWKGRRK